MQDEYLSNSFGLKFFDSVVAFRIPSLLII